MNNQFYTTFMVIISLIIGFGLFNSIPLKKIEMEQFPSDWFFMQRAFPWVKFHLKNIMKQLSNQNG